MCDTLVSPYTAGSVGAQAWHKATRQRQKRLARLGLLLHQMRHARGSALPHAQYTQMTRRGSFTRLEGVHGRFTCHFNAAGWPLQRTCKPGPLAAVPAVYVQYWGGWRKVLHPPSSSVYRYKLAANTIPRLIFSIAASKCSASSMLPTCNQGCPECQGLFSVSGASQPTMAGSSLAPTNRAWKVRYALNAAQSHNGIE